MNKLLFAATICFCLLLSACATTGDPNRGGLFGWSEDKAVERQRGLKTDLEREEQQSEALRLEQQKLETKIAAKKRELAALEQNTADSASGPTAAEAEQIKQLNKEIDALNDEALALMDM